jgi:hypothetical protein
MNEEYCVGYAEGYQTGWNEAMDEKTARAAAMSVAWVGLTDDEIKGIIGAWGDTPIKGYTRKLFDQIEAKLKEKNYD